MTPSTNSPATRWVARFSATVAALFLAAQSALAQQRPNVVFILADDFGWRDTSEAGSTFYETPSIDSIAATGMKFTHGYATCQVCSPSRASIMTGRYPARLAITDWIGAAAGFDWKRNTRLLPATYNHNLPLDQTTMAEAFRNAGYKTFFAGKWHLGGNGSLPQDHGFDINVGGHHRGSPPGGFFSPYSNPEMESGPVGEYLPLRLGRETSRFIEENREGPFFAFLSFYAVHAPLQTTRELWQKYRDKAAAQTAPESRFVVDRTTPVRQVQDHPLYGGLVEAMDQAIGDVLSTLDRLGLSENTVVVFTSDNGGVSAGDAKATSNLPLRGGKGRQWEGGIREPYFIRWPGVTEPGSESDTPATGTDFYPTLLDIAGIDSLPHQHVDGASLVPALKGGPMPKRALFWHYPHYGNQGGEPSSIILDGDWKLIYYYEDGRRELYNIAADIGEQNDLASRESQRANEMFERLFRWLEETEARFPVLNPNFDLEKHAAQQRNIETRGIANLEKEHEGYLDPEWSPRGGWWEVTGE